MASSTSNKPDRASLEEVVSRADFELVQSFLRVARLLQPQSTNIDSARTRHISHGSSPVPSTVPNTPPSVPHVDHDYCNNEPMILDEDGVGNDNEGNRYVGEIPRSKRYNTHVSQKETQQRGPRETTSGTPIASQCQQRQGEALQSRQTQSQHHQRPHAAVEKRYRAVLNNKIEQLCAATAPLDTFDPIEAAQEPASSTSTEKPPKVLAKSAVLDRAVKYIEHLVSTCEQYETEQENLRARLQLFLLDNPPTPPDAKDVMYS
ncbi:hypothetical protein G7054_g8362 [Neopestalotiopsis clavispora]|nr:hypothetical protein G7054_g8362 [Neopestalotiopsis clavispora]